MTYENLLYRVKMKKNGQRLKGTFVLDLDDKVRKDQFG